MTILELFPWLLAASVAALTGTLLARGGSSGAIVWIIAAAAGIVAFAAYWLALKSLASWLERRKARKEKWERGRRRYHDFELAKPHPTGSSLFYECSVCGNVIPSEPTKGACCKCRNIMVEADTPRIEIRDPAKVRLFSLIAASDSQRMKLRPLKMVVALSGAGAICGFTLASLGIILGRRGWVRAGTLVFFAAFGVSSIPLVGFCCYSLQRKLRGWFRGKRRSGGQ